MAAFTEIHAKGFDPPLPTPLLSVLKESFSGVTMALLAGVLSQRPDVERVVRDRTDLTGGFDVDLEFRPFSATPATADGTAVSADSGSALFTALQEQLGLKLEPMRGPVDVLVIDHVERPTED